MAFSPIVLFVYNRPWHTQQTIEALQKNHLAKKSDLYIYSDAPKTIHDTGKVDETRRYIKTIKAFQSITIIERDVNWGLADSIVDGVTSIVNKFDTVIVLEDDIVTSENFLTFMNDSLLFYKKHRSVMTISAYSYPFNKSTLNETFLANYSACWGWATWADRWVLYDDSISNFKKNIRGKDRALFQIYPPANIFWRQIKQNESKQIKTWAVFWYASMFINNGLTLFPKNALAKNIGFDNSGVNCAVENTSFNTQIYQNHIKYFERNITANKLAYDAMRKYLKESHKTLLQRVIKKVKSLSLCL